MSEEADKAKTRLLEARADYKACQSEYHIARKLYEDHIREDIFSIQMTGNQVRLVLDLIIKNGYSDNGYNDKLVFELKAILQP